MRKCRSEPLPVFYNEERTHQGLITLPLMKYILLKKIAKGEQINHYENLISYPAGGV